jgi:peptidoglycan/LPS O-acetylase OafA/YrhL
MTSPRPVSQSLKANTQKPDQLLILRGLACLMVFFSHIYPPLEGGWLSVISPFLFASGSSGVQIFFVLSGYLIGKAFYTKRYEFNLSSLRQFYASRIKRIVPLYYVISLLLLLIFFPYFTNSWPGWNKILSIFTFTFNISQQPLFSGHWWSLSVEVQFYVLAPLLAFICFKLIKLNSWVKITLALTTSLISLQLIRFLQARHYLDLPPVPHPIY